MLYLAGALLFAISGYAALALADILTRNIEPFADGPAPASPPPSWLLAVGCSLIGVLTIAQAHSWLEIVLVAMLCSALAGAWYADCRCGIVPDVFTLGPLAIILALAGAAHQWGVFAAAFIPLVPFALAALLSQGRGMGWADVKLAALAGAALGIQHALIALAAACIAAAVYTYAVQKRSRPIAFVPYIAGAIAAALPLVVAG